MPPQLPPATPGGPRAFGASSVQSSATKDDGGKKKVKKKEDEEGGAMSFLNDTLPPDLRRWFSDPQFELSDIHNELQKLAKRTNAVREVAKAENARLRSEIEGLLKENETLKTSQQPNAHYGGGHKQRIPRGNLPTVQEEVEYEDDPRYTGAVVGTGDDGDAMRTILGKRPAGDSFERQEISAMGRPTQLPMQSDIYSQDVLSTPRRPMSVGGYRGNQLSGMSRRLDLESYRMDAPPSTTLPYQPDSHVRSMTPLQRAASARPYIQDRSGSMLPPSGIPQANHQGMYEDQPGIYEQTERYRHQGQYERNHHDENQYSDAFGDHTRSAPGRSAGNGFQLASRPVSKMPPPF
ncbi:hypothetical protein I316_03886 [Kwoniella heveanensis BCC8398]|uniref:Uncharacterized protein n=1 Tax=Kwoniella heveanensis BCC8398 TaxID=1296120 RepID=A0A1B9GTH6_9TREE|nr:hypothetical protein I316_03886 [Kwoniella heveanensis BCC8398]